MHIDEQDLPDIDDVVPDDYPDEDDEDKAYDRKVRKIREYIKKNRITPRSYRKRRALTVKELRQVIRELNMLLYAESYQTRQTQSGFVNKQSALRRGIVKSLLAGLPVDAKIIIAQDLLRELEGDTEPAEYYIW